MHKFLSITLLLLSLKASALETQIMQIYEGNTFKEVTVYKKGNGKNTVLMNEVCMNSKKCISKRVLLDKQEGLAGHPGSKACKTFKHSEYKILKTKSGDQIGFCRFSDGSMISAWSLLRD